MRDNDYPKELIIYWDKSLDHFGRDLVVKSSDTDTDYDLCDIYNDFSDSELDYIYTVN